METRSGRALFLATVVCLVCAVGLLSVAGSSVADDGDRELVEECAATPPDDYAAPADGNETIGWFDGYW